MNINFFQYEIYASEKDNKPHNLPLWEIGVFSGVAILPHYLGSNEEEIYAVPVPYLRYRGEVVKADRSGLRSVFYKQDNITLDLSFAGHPPVTDDNEARYDMEELGPMLEIGPSCKYYFKKEAKAKYQLYLDLSVRKAFSVDMDNLLRLSGEGYHGGVKLVYRFNSLFHYYSDYSCGMSLGVDFTDKGYNKYYYDVSKDYADNERNEFSSHGGYAGTYMSAYIFKRLSERLKISSYVRYVSLDSSKYENSPLVKRNSYFMVGLACTFKLKQSKKYSMY